MSNHLHDHTLIEAARLGDADAVSVLLRQCHPDVTRFAQTVCATPQDVEDAVQEALWIVAQKIGTLRVATAFTTWIFQVVKHECYKLLRRARREIPLTDIAESVSSEEPFGLEALLTRDLVEAITKLGPIYQQVFVMRDIEGLTAPEVAAALGVSVDAVKSRLHRARLSIRDALQHWAVEYQQT